MIRPVRDVRTESMNINCAVAALATLALAAAPALVRAQTNIVAPIVIDNVQIDVPESIGNGEITTPGSLRLAFRNTRSVAATHIVFAIRGDGTMRTLDESGTFAPNVVINHVFNDDCPTSNQTITVVRVQFADGTSWVNED